MSDDYILKIKLNDSSMEPYYKFHGHAYPGDCGIDIYVSKTITIPPNSLSNQINTSICLELINCNTNKNSSYIVVPRSSLSKTPLRSSNSINIIDSSYRGELLFIVDNLSKEPYTINKGRKLFQILNPRLNSMKIEIVVELSDGIRGSRGFGSSGISKL